MTNICKQDNIYSKYDPDYFVLLNLNYNAIFIFEKYVGIIWKTLDKTPSFVDLLSELKKEGYSVSVKEIISLIDIFSKCGLVYNDEIAEDSEFISANNQMELYTKRCTRLSNPAISRLEFDGNCNLKCIHCFHNEAFRCL